MVEMVIAEEAEVHPCQDVRLVIGIAVSTEQQYGIAYQQHSHRGQGVPVVHEEGKQGGSTVTECNTLHHSPDTQVGKIQGPSVTGQVKPVDEEADEEDDQRALQNLPAHLCRPFEVELPQRQIGTDTHNEQEEGEHQVAGCHSVPLSMLQWGIGVTIAVVH